MRAPGGIGAVESRSEIPKCVHTIVFPFVPLPERIQSSSFAAWKPCMTVFGRMLESFGRVCSQMSVSLSTPRTATLFGIVRRSSRQASKTEAAHRSKAANTASGLGRDAIHSDSGPCCSDTIASRCLWATAVMNALPLAFDHSRPSGSGTNPYAAKRPSESKYLAASRPKALLSLNTYASATCRVVWCRRSMATTGTPAEKMASMIGVEHAP